MMIRVKAVAGRMLPDPFRKQSFVGYREVRGADERADHEVPGGKRYALIAEGVLVNSTLYVRNAIRSGDLKLADEPSKAEHPDVSVRSFSED